MIDSGNDLRGDPSGRVEKTLILEQCAVRTVIAVIILAAARFSWWLGLTLLVIFALIVLVNMLPTLITLIVEGIVGVIAYARIRRGINLQNLERFDGKNLEMNLVEIGKMNLYLAGKEIYSIMLVSALSFFIYLEA